MLSDSPSPVVDRVLRRLENVQPSGAGWKAKCPAHDDESGDSLSIGEGNDGRALLHCFAGCVPEAIVGAIELTMRDLFADRATRRRKQRKAEKEGAGTSPEILEPLKPGEGLALAE